MNNAFNFCGTMNSKAFLIYFKTQGKTLKTQNRFDQYIQPKKNVTSETCVFCQARQQQNETIDLFVTRLCQQAKFSE